MAQSAGGWLRSLSFRPTPCPSGIPLPWEGGRWATHPASPSFLWKEVAQSAGGWLRSLSPSANPRPSGIPLPWEGGRWATHSASPSFLWKEVARSAGGWLRSLSPSANPRPSGIPPSMGRGDGLLIPLLPPSAGRRWRVAPEVGFALFRLQPIPALRASPSMRRGRFLTASPSFLRKEKICYLNSLQRSSKTSWLGFST